MAKNQKISLIVIACLSVVAVGLYGLNSMGIAKKGDSEIKRVKIKPFQIEDTSDIKKKVDVQHEFDEYFTANVTEDQLEALFELAEVEDVAIYEIAAQPVCGDGEIHPSEKCGEPRTYNCSEGTYCDDCKCKNQKEFIRDCTPPEQYPYGVQMVNGGSGGEGVSVLVLDTGVKTAHPDLNVSVCKDATQKGLKNGCEDYNAHGTHVAGSVAANGGPDGLGIYGVAPEAELWVIKVCDDNGQCYTDDIAEAMRYGANRGVDIMNISLTGDEDEPIFKEAMEHAASKGVLIIGAAGNWGPGPDTIGYPASYTDVVAVGAVDQNKDVTIWSSRGINDGDYIIEEREIEVVGPGDMVLSTFSHPGLCYAHLRGTSMATPHIAGLAAKLWQGSAQATRTYLQELAKLNDLGDPGDDPAAGFGLPIAP